MNEWSSGKGFSLNKLPRVIYRAGANLAKANASILAQIIEKYSLRSIIYNMLSRMNEWFSGKGFDLNYHVFALVQFSPKQIQTF